MLEFVAQDPKQGSIFYTLEQSAAGTPQFERNDTCVMCHVSDATHYVPGLFVGSVFPSVNGTTMYGPAYTTDHRSPFELRWGGWFVTGTHQATRHMGNAVATDPSDLGAMITPETRSRHEPERPVRHDRIPLAVQRHRRAARARASGADAEPDHACRMGGTRGRRRSRIGHSRRPSRSSLTTCCSSTSRRCPDRSADRRRSRSGSAKAAPRDSARALTARPGSDAPAAEVSLQLSDLLGGVRCAPCRRRRTQCINACGRC